MPSADIKVTNAIIDPPNTYRASKLSDCYSITPSLKELTYTYRVGVIPKFEPYKFSIKNNTVSHDLKVTINTPSFTSVDKRIIIIPKNSAKEIRVLFNEVDAKNKVMSGIRNFSEDISIDIEVVNVVGPVYVKTNNHVDD